MHNIKLLKEIRDRAFKTYINDPLNEESRKLFFESNKLFLTTERDEEDEEDFEFSNSSSDDENSGFDIFSDDDSVDTAGAESPLRKVKLIQRNPVDPPFGLKAALCFDSVSSYEKSVIQSIAKLQKQHAKDEDLISTAGLYEPYVKDKLDRAKKKYQDALRDLEAAREIDKTRTELTYDSFVADELGNISPSDIPKNLRSKFLSKREGDLGKFISRDQMGATVTGVGAGELEFLARMFFVSVGGSYPGISNNIKVGERSREESSNQEKQLYELAPSQVGYYSLRTLRDYLSHAVREALQPIVNEIHIDEFVDIGIDHAMDGIAAGKYNFDNANIASWTFQVVKNKAKDLLKRVSDYKYDDSIASNWTSSLSFPFSVFSKANPSKALDLKSKGVLHFEMVDIGKTYSIKSEKDKFFKYTYNNEYDLLEDLRISNGFYSSVGAEAQKVAGRKKQHLEDSPVYFQNLSIQQRKNFMTSFSKAKFIDPEDFPELSTSKVPVLDSKGREEKALETIKVMQSYIDGVVNSIYDKIVSDTSNKYSQRNIMTYIKNNPDLSKKLIKGFLNFGVYKFQRDHYDFVTSPETHLQDFFNDLYKSEYPGKDLPQTISNNKAQIPMKTFVQDMRRIVLGTGVANREYLPLALSGEEASEEQFKKMMLTKLKPNPGESEEEYKKRVMSAPQEEMKMSGGFFIQNPEFLKDLYKNLRNMSVKTLVGREGSVGLDESFKSVKSLIIEIRNDFESYKKQITKNFIKSWN